MRGDHIYVQRRGYAHHGIDLGDGTVIQYSGEPGKSKIAASICAASMAVFLSGSKLRVRQYGVRSSADDTVNRAMSKLGETGYNLIDNNCEHFATWCATGKSASQQVNGAVSGVAVTATAGSAGVAGIGVVSATGAVGGLSASGIMSGLATVGGTVGGGAVGGLYLLSAGPGLATAGIMNLALKDGEHLPDTERTARRVGRLASFAGSAGGSVAGVAAVSTLGTAGLSAAGISSGLAAVGGVVGGGMAAGTAVVVAGPALVAAAVGYGGYRGVRAVLAHRRAA